MAIGRLNPDSDREYVNAGVFRERTENLSEKIDGISDKLDRLDAYLRNGLSEKVVRNSTWLKIIVGVYTSALISMFGGLLWVMTH